MNTLIVPQLGTPRPLVMTTYDVAVNGLTGNGTVTAAGAARDVAGNLSQASSSQDDMVLFSGQG